MNQIRSVGKKPKWLHEMKISLFNIQMCIGIDPILINQMVPKTLANFSTSKMPPYFKHMYNESFNSF